METNECQSCAFYKQLAEAYQMISIGIQSHQMNKVAYGYSQIEALQKSPGAPVETPAQIAFKQRKPELIKALDEIKEFLKNG